MFFLSQNISSQKFIILDSDFSLIEKKDFKADSKNSLIMGHVLYNSSDDSAEFNIKFPEMEKWILRDTILIKYKNDTIFSQQFVGTLSENFIFKSILQPSENDFGLKAAGFEIDEVQEMDGIITISWLAPPNLKHVVNKAVSTLKDNLLQSVTFLDTQDKIMNQTIYEKYELINTMPIPVHISTRFVTDDKSIIKVLKLKNVKIN